MNVALCTDGDRPQQRGDAHAQRADAGVAGAGAGAAGVQLQQLDELCRAGEGVGSDAAVVQVQRDAGDTVDLGDQRGAAQRGAVVEQREVGQRARVGIAGVAE